MDATVGGKEFVLFGRMNNFKIELGKDCEARVRTHLRRRCGINKFEADAEIERLKRTVYEAIQNREQ